MGSPIIKLENPHTEVGFPDLSGFHPDCTFTLNNTGEADGFATVDLKTDSGALLKKEEFPVPKKTAPTYHLKVNMSFWPIPGSDTIKYNIESNRSATWTNRRRCSNRDVTSGAELPRLNAGCNDIVFSPDGRKMALIGYMDVNIMDTATILN